jgi:hypothetical protein
MPPRDPPDRAGDFAKAGRFLFDAVFGKPGDFERSVRDELDAEEARTRPTTSARSTEIVVAPKPAPAATDLPPSILRCTDCGREQQIPATFGRADVERLGWRRVDRAWRCSLCTD